jgi:hypothetical protein
MGPGMNAQLYTLRDVYATADWRLDEISAEHRGISESTKSRLLNRWGPRRNFVSRFVSTSVQSHLFSTVLTILSGSSEML